MAEATGNGNRGGGRRWPWLLGGIAVLAAGGAGFWLLSRQSPGEPQPPPPPPLVETAPVEPAERIVLRQTAFVRPVAELPVLPETTAPIEAVSPAFDRGRRVAEGEVLVRLDPTELAAAVARAEAALGEAEAAAPFDAIVREVAADPGELANPQTELGRLVAVDAVELEVGLLPRDLALLPGGADALPGARVLLREAPGAPVLAEGAVASVESGLAAGSALVPLVVRVVDPFEGARPLRLDELLLAELPVEIAGGGAVSVPARALKPEGVVWAVRDRRLVRTAPKLLIRQATPEGERAVLRAGALRPGARVLLTDLPAATEGQDVRLGEDGAGSDGASDDGS
ncbi:HlyD family efflux transporter periplasmic adaptor subunit [Jannaschia formosa]|uniref:HlyD family efflux transporter periplasmic adaptor subunit n=1 Tax=Jannaschia formosa TaxID=2259592 RepID=UPI000E1BB609|nr:HlyD family efflux transporter periplasmic adaptor subunit [Jannaschia formosa]TFL18823.1 biotin/lipoyl-binding protein [Jannaschia formosa]